MTREEALQILDTIPTIGEQVDALEMAISALEQEPCEDAISREAVLDALLDYWHDIQFVDGTGYDVFEDSEEVIKALPSVTPSRRKGKGELYKGEFGEME